MKADVYTEYGPPVVFRLTEVAIPIPKEDEVLDKVSATSLNKDDLELLKSHSVIERWTM